MIYTTNVPDGAKFVEISAAETGPLKGKVELLRRYAESFSSLPLQKEDQWV